MITVELARAYSCDGRGGDNVSCIVSYTKTVCFIYSPMDPFNEGEIAEAIRKTFEGLAAKEETNETLFKDWPRIERTPYELAPKRRTQFGFGVVTNKSITIGIAIGLAAIGIGIGIGITR